MLYVGRGPRGNSVACSALCQLSSHFPHFPQAKWALLLPIPRWEDPLCVRSRPLWVSPTNSPVRWEFLPLPPQPPQVFSIRGLRLYFPALEPWVVGLSRSPVVPPGLCARGCGTTCSTCHHLATSPLCPDACLHPSCCLGECFFFNSLVVRLPHSLIFCQSGYFFKFIVVLLLVV